MEPNEKEIKRRLIAKRKIVKQKLDYLQQGETAHEDIFSPITKHLKNIETKLPPPAAVTHKEEEKATNKVVSPFILNEKDGSDFNEENISNNSTPLPPRRRLNFESMWENDENDEPSAIKRSLIEEANQQEENYATQLQTERETRNQRIFEESFQDYLEQYEPLPRKYIKNMITDVDKEFDHKYGIIFNEQNEKFFIGDSELKIVDSDIIVQGKRYKGTKGLYELLFKKYPLNFTVQDEKNYVDIIFKTNAHRRYYKSTEQVQGSILPKYKKIIGPAVRLVSGRGFSSKQAINNKELLMQYSSKPIEYVYWDNPNELVDRLRLLIASQSAGNNNHANEINSIIEELREISIIV